MYPKVSAGSLHAFESPNIAPLATVGISIQVDTKAVWRPGTISALTVQSRLCRDVVLLRLFPSIRSGSRVTRVSCCHVSRVLQDGDHPALPGAAHPRRGTAVLRGGQHAQQQAGPLDI